MIVYCILGIEYLAGYTTNAVPKIYGIYLDKVDALREHQNLLFSGVEGISISELEVK